MAVLQALQSATGALGRNPVLFVVAAVFGLLQLPGLVAQSLHPLVGAVVSMGFSAISIFVVPFFFGGIIGMANEALAGRTSLGTFVREGKAHYVSVLAVYFGLFAANLVLGFVVVLAVVFGGVLFFSGGGGSSNLLPLALVGLVGVLALLAYLSVVFVVQFFGHAIVVDDLTAVDGVKRSVRCVRRNLLAVLGYTLLSTVGGAVFGLLGGLFSLLTTPQFSGRPGSVTGPAAGAPATPFPTALPSVGVAGTVGLAVLLVVATGLFGGFFAGFSTAFYREIRPAGP